jgi:membrane protease YdiL (CAAX protease family)
MSSSINTHKKRNLVIFGLAVLGLAALGRIIEPFTVPPGADTGTSGLGQLLWIVAPVAVMLLLRLFGGDGWRDLGLRPNLRGNGLWWWVSVLVFPLVIAVSVLMGAALGGLTLNSAASAGLIGVFLTALASAAVKNLFEEFAWRGYLAPKLYSLNLNIWLSHVLVGLVWGAWHLPFAYLFWTTSLRICCGRLSRSCWWERWPRASSTARSGWQPIPCGRPGRCTPSAM